MLNEKASQVFKELPFLEATLNDDVKTNLVHIAGYITRKVDTAEDDSFLYYEKYGRYTHDLNRGGLKIPGDSTCQWVMFCFILFNSIQSNICRKSLIMVFQDVSEHYGFSERYSRCMILSNTLINMYCKKITPRSGKELKQKVIKLS